MAKYRTTAILGKELCLGSQFEGTVYYGKGRPDNRKVRQLVTVHP